MARKIVNLIISSFVGFFITDLQIAVAGAWVQEKDAGYQYIGVSYEDGDFGRGWRQDSYIEYGLKENWTVVGKLETVWRQHLNYNDRSSGKIGIRRPIWRRENWSIVGHSAFFVGEQLDDQSCGGFGGEIGGAIGYSGKFNGKPAYAFTNSAIGARQGCEHATTDFVVGIQPTKLWDIQVKAFAEKFPGREFVKMEIGASRKVQKSFVGVGIRKEISGAFEENSAFMSIWKKF
ncbi:hypothetical protein [Hirschia maritima]|uniref:hypothetical protein n=1 Tax=Hirschia maritima TaxID=1121961 RepID=UPI000399975F|nr:hypothetical protein [Hirschia maritima]